MGVSVHLADFRRAAAGPVDEELEASMDEVRVLSRLGRAAREEAGINVRRPLARALCVVPPRRVEGVTALLPILRLELNVKEAVLLTSADDLVTLEAKPNFRSLGRKFGKATPLAAKAVQAMASADLRRFEHGEELAVAVDGLSHALDGDDLVIIRRAVGDLVVKEAEGHFVAIDPVVTPTLRREGLAREVVSRLQRLRKERGFAVSDRIRLWIHGDPEIELAAREYIEWMAGEVLAREIVIGADARSGEPAALEGEIDGLALSVALKVDN
jgi:isoleucyl-tRNA synthetase